MRTFAWLLCSGVLWLALIRLAADVAVPPQLISLARSLYMGTFAVFMMVEIRRAQDQNQDQAPTAALSPRNMVWYLVPALSVLVLWWLSPTLHMTARLWTILGGFYLLQLALLGVRSARAGMRSGAWDLLVPAVLLPLLLHDMVALCAIALGALLLLWLMREAQSPPNGHVADALIMQLPSLCIAPVALIVLRDVFETSAVVERANMEMLGMVINGVGSALWTATVMRSKRLVSASVLLWCLGIAMAMTLELAFGTASAAYVAGALLAAEALRGSLWLGLTRLLSDSGRWQGFALNAVATALPLVALLAAHRVVAAQHVLVFYATLHVLVPLSLWVLLKHRRTAAA